MAMTLKKGYRIKLGHALSLHPLFITQHSNQFHQAANCSGLQHHHLSRKGSRAQLEHVLSVNTVSCTQHGNQANQSSIAGAN